MLHPITRFPQVGDQVFYFGPVGNGIPPDNGMGCPYVVTKVHISDRCIFESSKTGNGNRQLYHYTIQDIRTQLEYDVDDPEIGLAECYEYKSTS